MTKEEQTCVDILAEYIKIVRKQAVTMINLCKAADLTARQAVKLNTAGLMENILLMEMTRDDFDADSFIETVKLHVEYCKSSPFRSKPTTIQ